MKKLFIFLFGVSALILFAQDGAVDLNFNNDSGPNGSIIRAIALQADNKIVVAGDFTSYNNIARNGIARLNSDGSVDQTFNPGAGVVGSIHNVTIQQDEKIIIAGEFTKIGNVEKNHIARLNKDGSLDTSFNPNGSGPSAPVWSIAQQPDGKIMIAGTFVSYNGISRGRVARLNTDGTLDQSFDSEIGSDSILGSVVLQPDGKVLIGGYIINYNSIIRRTVARLNSNGTLDAGFNQLGTGANLPLSNMTLQPNGKVIISGFFTSYNTMNTGGVVRLNTDGSLDTTFEKNSSAGAYSSIVLPNGKILAAGSYYSNSMLFRLNSDGTLDKNFISNGMIQRMLIQPDGKILVCGNFTALNGVNKKQIARINGEDLLSVLQYEKDIIKIFPNPVENILKLKSNQPISDYELYSLDGKKISLGSTVNDSSINVSNLAKGSYLIKVKINGKEQTTKFIKE
ncbi:putative delta-60 repeat protein [Epilithonimonas hungarica]|uniref:T9SS type A sorting domain-containing protein n=1 Tax=Epilithonimonas hungarica TaxID=454006 RepID=UPI002783BF0C|nr:T9SS type A sorting domain-containing protein [Epilithonimonas hungarica]MDP9956245.1 putative delta-60 repeat protein [Epilithonimonas hungarica]